MFKRFLLALFFILPLKGHTSPSPQFKDLTILVPSCDKYSELWDPFYKILFDQWKSLNTENKDLPVIMISNHLDYPNDRIQVVKVGVESSWSQNMITALAQVKTAYVLIILEDYFLTSIDEHVLYDTMEIVMKKEKAGYVQLGMGDNRYTPKSHPHPHIKDLYLKPLNAKYRPSLQACLFDKNVLLRLLNPSENPWQFEVDGSIRSQSFQEKFYTFLDKMPLTYVNACYQGHVMTQALTFLKEKGIDFHPKNLKAQEDDYWFFFWEGTVKNTLRNIRDKVYATLGLFKKEPEKY